MSTNRFVSWKGMKGKTMIMKKISIVLILMFLITIISSVAYATEEEIENIEESKEVSEENIVNIQAGEKNYTGEMYIDSPTMNSQYILPDTKDIKISGWAVSNDENAVLKLYVNNVYWGNIARNVDRQDVLNEKSQYAQTKQTAGFSTNIDISNFPEDLHTIKVELVAINGKILSSQSIIIRVSPKTYSGELFIDSPTMNSQYILPDTKNIKLSGWAVSNDENAVLKLYVNNVCWGNIARNVDRQDVLNAKSQYAQTTRTAGFSTNIDISNFPEDLHTIKVEQISRYGKVISSQSVIIKVSKKTYIGEMFIDSPTMNSQYKLPDTKNIRLSGWAVSNDENSVLKLYVNNVCWGNIARNVDRQDVLNAKSQYAQTTRIAGFSTNMDISQFPEGLHSIRVDMVSRFGKVITSNNIIIKVNQKQFSGEIYIDGPANNTTFKVPDTKKMKLSGWGVSSDEKAVLKLYVNNVCWGNIARNIDRQDVLKIKAQYAQTTKKAGFSTDIDISNFPEGLHSIRVDMVSRYGKVITSKNVIINSSTPNYNGNLFVDAPIQNHKYSSRALEVKGWALSEDKDDCIKIYLNGQYATTAERTSREDVLNVYEGQFGGRATNTLPGYYSLVDISKLREGMHTLKIVNCSKFGKEIKSTEVRFMISNTKAWGIDVSHYQDDIDWNAVKNQGVTFAILKIGEYRESSGRIIQDPKFERNYEECKRLGILVGGYFYSYAFDPQEASHEAAACLSIIGTRKFEMPIFLDIEDKVITNAIAIGKTNPANITNGAITFCNIIIQNGHQAGVYASKNFFNNYLYTSLLENYDIWLAHYTGSTNYNGKFDIWQYTSLGTLSGIRGAVDLNWCFKRY